MTSGNLKTILTVDDNPLNRFLITTITTKIAPEATIKEAENGVEALEAFNSLRPDLIFMDIKLPGMSGYEVIQKIRALEVDKRTPIIVVSAGNSDEEDYSEYAPLIDGYLEKPIKFDALKSVLERIF